MHSYHLDASYAAWPSGAIGSGELDHRIHKHETGTARQLFKVNGDQVPAELLGAVEHPISYFRSPEGQSELRLPE